MIVAQFLSLSTADDRKFDAVLLGARDEVDDRRLPAHAKLQSSPDELAKCKIVKLRDPGPNNTDEYLAAMQALTRTVFWKYVRWGFKSQQRVPGKTLQELFKKLNFPPEQIKPIMNCHGLTYFQPNTGMLD